jgi:hypothetical protein
MLTRRQWVRSRQRAGWRQWLVRGQGGRRLQGMMLECMEGQGSRRLQGTLHEQAGRWPLCDREGVLGEGKLEA